MISRGQSGGVLFLTLLAPADQCDVFGREGAAGVAAVSMQANAAIMLHGRVVSSSG